MPDYLSYTFEDTEDFIHTFDEVPLWSASFGLLLLKHLELKPDLKVIDLGCGAGFPLLELAERLGKSCHLYGIDPWKNAMVRTKQKIKAYGITNVEIIEGSAEQIPLDANAIDLIVSNLGINNFENRESVFKECYRVLKPGGKLALTTNLNGHWNEFYRLFEHVLKANGKNDLVSSLIAQEQHRGDIESISKLFTDAGLKVKRYFRDEFDMTFVDGNAFLNHHFVKLGWLGSWKSLMHKDDLKNIFLNLERALNAHAIKHGGLRLTVPMLFIEGEKAT